MEECVNKLRLSSYMLLCVTVLCNIVTTYIGYMFTHHNQLFPWLTTLFPSHICSEARTAVKLVSRSSSNSSCSKNLFL